MNIYIQETNKQTKDRVADTMGGQQVKTREKERKNINHLKSFSKHQVTEML